MEEKRYKYMREDFGDLPVMLDHLTIYLNFVGDYVEAANCLEMTASQTMKELHLDANGIEILKVAWCESRSDEGIPLDYGYDRVKNRLSIRLAEKVEKGRKFL